MLILVLQESLLIMMFIRIIIKDVRWALTLAIDIVDYIGISF
jgi:hypothetical protein